MKLTGHKHCQKEFYI